MKNKVEILAPAGSPEALKAAVRCGADAVYFGTKTFNARRTAKNFDFDEMAEAAAYCRGRGVKVYITLNTLAGDKDFTEALAVAERACAAGADALILQDLGLAAAVREAAPGMKLHASTQMSVQTLKGIELLEKLGFSRIVLPRELSREEVLALTEDAPIELEMFVHGAQCMSVSGQCYMSAALGTRSANRGMCAAPCRLPFSAPGGTGFDLSLKDLSLIKHLPFLAERGITSFKIEGRLKRPEYVAAAVVACREALEGELTRESRSNLEMMFSREGFSDGHCLSERGRGMFGVRQKDDEPAFESALSELQNLYGQENPLLPVDFVFTAKSGEPPELSAHANGKRVSVRSEEVAQQAQKKSASPGVVEEALKKCGGTQFFARNIDINLQEGLYLPLSLINALRREALNGLNALLKEGKSIPFSPSSETVTEHAANNPVLYARFSNLSQIPESLDNIECIWLPLSTDENTLKTFAEGSVKAAVELPRGIFGGSDGIRKLLKRAKAAGIKTAVAGTLDGVALALGEGFEVLAGPGTNIFNTRSIKTLSREGVTAVLVSTEMTLKQSAALGGDLPRGIFAYGRLPLMLTRACPLNNGKKCADCGGSGALRDRMGIEFPVICEAGCSVVYNSRPVYLGDKKEEIKNMDFLLLYFTTESREEAGLVIKDFSAGVPPRGEFTRGAAYRGVE